MFSQRVCLRRARVIHHHGAWVNDFWLPLWGHNAPRGTGPLLGKTQSHECIREDIKGHAYKKYDSSMEVRWRKSARQTQTGWVCCLESTWSSCAAVLNIFLCNVQSLRSDLKASVVYSFPTAIFQNEGMPWPVTMLGIWGKLERRFKYSIFYIPQSEILTIKRCCNRKSRPSSVVFSLRGLMNLPS